MSFMTEYLKQQHMDTDEGELAVLLPAAWVFSRGEKACQVGLC